MLGHWGQWGCLGIGDSGDTGNAGDARSIGYVGALGILEMPSRNIGFVIITVLHLNVCYVNINKISGN